jgi:hypothetical protein
MTAGTDKDVNDLMFGGSVPFWDFNVQAEVKGRITALGKIHKPDIDNKTMRAKGKLYWQPDNTIGSTVTDSPVYEPLFTLVTPYRKWEGVKTPSMISEDDSQRLLRLTARSKKNPGSVKDAVMHACIAAKSKVHVGDYVEVRRVSGKGNPSSPYMYESVYYTAANPPEWAKDIVEPVSEDSGDELFD